MGNSSDWVEAGEGVRRRVLADDPGMMVVEFRFEQGAVGALHHHPHLQSSFVASGRFDYEIAGETRRLGPGDAVVIPGGAVHGCTAVEAGTLLDVFAPRRADFAPDPA
ncbi:cupin domain-containing protein [Jannaschia sp. W003]|uniref:cupin domain-containing protein n=1 Tax=Jannaschia sp. W003 TaxID=2867012 RepID=UPI0021A5DE0F|nr:cupin domain-containing protein [Jannaschia sp. W003]UWQ23199.1 cupin domain-containing protein [Jannaschia sp. W003]